MNTTTLLRWTGKVGPANLNSDYAMPFTVVATTREEAIAKAIEIGGYSVRDSSVWIHSADALEEPTLNSMLLAKAWREGYQAASISTGSPTDTDSLSIDTPNPYEEANRG